jgi:site-specific DNA-methyltransferase (adenine-specific)
MNIEILEGDAIHCLTQIASKSIDIVVADPPYNLGKDYGNSHDKKSFDEFMDFSRQWIKESHRILKSSGTIYIFMGVRFISYLYSLLEKEHNFFF